MKYRFTWEKTFVIDVDTIIDAKNKKEAIKRFKEEEGYEDYDPLEEVLIEKVDG